MIKAIYINSATDVNIKPFKGGLMVDTHKESKIVTDKDSLRIEGPFTVSTDSSNNFPDNHIAIYIVAFILTFYIHTSFALLFLLMGFYDFVLLFKWYDSYALRSTHAILCEYSIESLVICGCSHVNVSISLNPDKSEIKVSGTATVTLNEAHQVFTSLEVELMGNGEVRLGNALIDNANVRVYGSGKVKDFFIVENASLVMKGSGSINASATDYTRIDQSSSGSGYIALKRDKAHPHRRSTK